MFVKGVSGNPAGKPKGTRDMWPELYSALRKVEKRKKKLFAERLVEMAWDNPKIAIGLADKFFADLPKDIQLDGQDAIPLVMIAPAGVTNGMFHPQIELAHNGSNGNGNGNRLPE